MGVQVILLYPPWSYTRVYSSIRAPEPEPAAAAPAEGEAAPAEGEAAAAEPAAVEAAA